MFTRVLIYKWLKTGQVRLGRQLTVHRVNRPRKRGNKVNLIIGK